MPGAMFTWRHLTTKKKGVKPNVHVGRSVGRSVGRAKNIKYNILVSLNLLKKLGFITNAPP